LIDRKSTEEKVDEGEKEAVQAVDEEEESE